LTPQEFYELTPWEFRAITAGHSKRAEFEQRQQWERTRWQVCMLINIQLPKDKKLELTDVLEFPDERPAERAVTKEEKQRRIAQLIKWGKNDE